MPLENAITPDELSEFLKEAADLHTTVNPTLVDEITQFTNQPPADWILLKNGSRSQIGAVQLEDGREIVLKYYHPKKIFKKLNYRIRGSRCQRSWIAGLALDKVGIPTPKPLLIAEQTSALGLLNSQSLLVTERAAGTSLRSLPPERLEMVIPLLTNHFELFSDYHIAHGDLKASNIIVDDANQPSFIDLDATRFLLSGKAWDRARASDRLRFKRNWQNHPAATMMEKCFSY